MAQLDVRERRIETTIAYLGPDFAGRSTNLHHLGGGAEMDAATRSIAWRPIGLTRFDDCDVSVRVVAPRGSLDDEEVRRAVQEADGVVVVLDGDPAARERNLQWLDPARALLAPRDGAPRNVVVQVNKADLAGEVGLAELVEQLDLGSWPHVPASAMRGEGVVETIRCVLDSVLASLEGGTAEEVPARAREGAHPLLTALRQVLAESIDARVGAIEGRIIDTLTARNEAHAAGVRAEIAAVEERIATRGTAATLEQIAALHADFAESSVQLAQLRDDIARLETKLGAALAAQSKTDVVQKSDVEAVERRVREELIAASRADREHQTATGTALRRAIEALKVDLRPLDHTSEIRTVAERITRLSERLDEAFAVVVPTAAAVRSIPLRMGESQDRTRNVVLKSVEELGQRVEASLEELNQGGGAVWARIDERSAKVEAAVEELLEELKKRKKGWFG